MARIFKDWLKAYVKYTELSESPDLFHFWTGVSTIAGALRRRVWIEMDTFQWTPNFYVIFVADPGIVSKSTSLDLGMDLLRDIDGVKFGPISATWQALGESFQEAHEGVPVNANDLEGELDEMSCVTCAFSELGTFLEFKDQKLISVLIELWDGRKSVFEHRTRSNGSIVIKNPWLNIIGATTPSWLKTNAPPEFIGGGLASRIIFVYGDRKRKLVPYPGLVRERGEKAKLREGLLTDLRAMSNMYGEYQLAPEVIKLGSEWYIQHWETRPIHMASDRYKGYIARKQTHIHKLAIVLAAARHESMWIEEQDFVDARNITTAMEADMVNAFESIGVTPMNRMLNEIMSFLDTYRRAGAPVSRQMLWRHCIALMSEKEFTEVTGAAVNAGYLKIFNSNGDIYYELLVNPRDLKEKVE